MDFRIRGPLEVAGGDATVALAGTQGAGGRRRSAAHACPPVMSPRLIAIGSTCCGSSDSSRRRRPPTRQPPRRRAARGWLSRERRRALHRVPHSRTRSSHTTASTSSRRCCFRTNRARRSYADPSVASMRSLNRIAPRLCGGRFELWIDARRGYAPCDGWPRPKTFGHLADLRVIADAGRRVRVEVRPRLGISSGVIGVFYPTG
jgi:hypothetical protein